MYRIVRSSNINLPDVSEFNEILNTPGQSPFVEARDLFDAGREIVVARAPGRLDVMGGIADYSGSLVLQLPIREGTFAALQRDASRRVRIVSLARDNSRASAYEMSATEFHGLGRSATYESLRARFQADPGTRWAAYVAGVFPVLMRELNADFPEGARILIWSRVPEGKGVSSSAALEVAAMHAVCVAFEIPVGAQQIALLCQKVENYIVGAPCGVMDQMTAACGEPDKLLALLCQPAELREPIAVHEGVAFWGIDSGERHAVAGDAYTSVRVGAFMGYRIIAELAGLKVSRRDQDQTVVVDDPKWRGYLSNVSPSEFEQRFLRHIPERVSGEEFLARYGGTTDPATRVIESRSYAVRAPTEHAIREHDRVRRFAELLGASIDDQRLKLLGELMYQSHASYSACGLGSAGTDRLVSLVREAGYEKGLFGARVTGGGSGGTVAVVGRRDAGDVISELTSRYADETGYNPRVFSGSSPGSEAFGYYKLSCA